ncbi:KAP family NTPase [bacterium]|nr:KAP family NTPase [bacterium]
MLKEEVPIRGKAEDLLGRYHFAEGLASALSGWSGDESIVVGLCGEWGSGKTSIINLVLEELDGLPEEDESSPTVINFNPWTISGEGDITERFFTELSEQLRLKDESEEAAKLAAMLLEWGEILRFVPAAKLSPEDIRRILFVIATVAGFSSLSAVQLLSSINWLVILSMITTVVLFSLGCIKNISLWLAEYFERQSSRGQKSIHEWKLQLKGEISKRSRNILVVMDDVDRLMPDEVREVFKLVRINADFPRMVYLLAYDRVVIEESLTSQLGICGRSFLEKIVQQSFNLPAIPADSLYSLLTTELDRIIGSLPERAWGFFSPQDSRWGNVYHSGFRELFGNLRDVKRFTGSLEFNLAQFHERPVLEVNPIDFIALEGIRVFEPDVYSFMRNHSELFTVGLDEAESEAKSRKALAEYLKSLEGQSSKRILQLLGELFPKVRDIDRKQVGHYSDSNAKHWRSTLMLCSPELYKTYFALAPGGSSSSICQWEIDAIRSSLGSFSSCLKELRRWILSGRLRPLLSKLEDYTSPGEIGEDEGRNLLHALYDSFHLLPNDDGAFAQVSTRLLISRLTTKLLRNHEPTSVVEFIRRMIEESTQLIGPLQEV